MKGNHITLLLFLIFGVFLLSMCRNSKELVDRPNSKKVYDESLLEFEYDATRYDVTISPPRFSVDTMTLYPNLKRNLRFTNKLDWPGVRSSHAVFEIDSSAQWSLKYLQSSPSWKSRMPGIVEDIRKGIVVLEPAFSKSLQRKEKFEVAFWLSLRQDHIEVKVLGMNNERIVFKNFARPL